MQQVIFIADLIACSTCFGHHYAHRQELESILQMVAACGIWCFGFQVVGMVWSWRLCVRFAGCYLKEQQPANRTQTSAPHHTDNLKTKAPNTTGSNHLYNSLELMMMGIMVPETCWASNKICNKNHVLHLIGILFPHIRLTKCSLNLKSQELVLNTFAASYLNTQGLNNSCLKSPASTLVDLTFQSRALRSFSLNQLRNLSL